MSDFEVKWNLKDLQNQHLPRLNWRTIMTFSGEPLSAIHEQELDKHFLQFLPPEGDCVGCGSRLGVKDDKEAFLAMFGVQEATFVWGMTHGSGYCSKCGYPAQAYHYNVGPIARAMMILQPHPDELKE